MTPPCESRGLAKRTARERFSAAASRNPAHGYACVPPLFIDATPTHADQRRAMLFSERRATMPITPMLTVRGAVGLADFYTRAFDARETQRFSTPTGQNIIGLAIDGSEFYLVDENPAAFNVSPEAIGGTTVRLNLVVKDPDAVMRAALDAGASEVFPLDDQP